jgi:hypothetical protein
MKNLVRFWKGIDREAYDALETKDPSTLYFISDTREIVLGEKSYGGSNLFSLDSGAEGTITFSVVDGKIVPAATLSPNENAIVAKPDGLYIPSGGVTAPADLVDGHFIYATDTGNIKDSGISLVTAISSSSTDTQVPSSAAVYEALIRIAPIWETVDSVEDLVAWQNHSWRDFLPLVTFEPGIELDASKHNFFECDGREARISLYLNFASVGGNPADPYFPIASFPKVLNPKARRYFYPGFFNSSDQVLPMYPPYLEGGKIWADNTVTLEDGESYRLVFSGVYFL